MIGGDAEHTIAVGLLQKPSRFVDVDGTISPEHFGEIYPKRIFVLASRYRAARNGANALDLALARSLVEQATSKAVRSVLPTLEEYAKLGEVSDAEFRDAVGRLRASRRAALTKERATEAVEASLAGEDERARAVMRRALLEADDQDDDRPVDLSSPEEFDAELRELRKPVGSGACLDVGFDFLTDRAPVRPGMLTVLAGYTGDGKTQWAKTIAYNAAVRSGARVFYTSLEMSKREMKVLLLCAHAATIDPRGVPWSKILSKEASREELRLYARAMLDWKIREGAGDDPDCATTPGGGRIYLWRPKRRPTMGAWCERAEIMHLEKGVNVAVGDYLELFRATRHSGERRHELTEMAYEAKDLAGEDDPRMWVLLLHQINRDGRREAMKRSPRGYMTYDLKDSSGIEAAASSIWWIFSDEVLKGDRQARAGSAKVREGEPLIDGDEIHFDPRIAVVGELAR